MSKKIELGMNFNFEKYTTIQCLNSSCNHKFTEIDEERKCRYFVKKED